MDAVTGATIPISLTDLENLIHRVMREVVREEMREMVREELERVSHAPARSILDDWGQEGPDDPAGDEESLEEALVTLEEYKDRPETWMKWDDFEVELDRAEAAGELLH